MAEFSNSLNFITIFTNPCTIIQNFINYFNAIILFKQIQYNGIHIVSDGIKYLKNDKYVLIIICEVLWPMC